MALTDAKLKALKPREKAYKAFDAGSLFILVWPKGGKLRRFRFLFNGKENLLALSKYPSAEQRQERAGQLAANTRTFEIVARDEVGGLLLNLSRYKGVVEARDALELALMTVIRTSELRAALWDEFERPDKPEAALWRIPAQRMKMDEVHLAPLSQQAVKVLLRLRQRTGTL